MTHSKLIAFPVGVLSLSLALKAQYLGDQQLGIAGLEAGTMPAPGIYVTVPLYYRFSDISLYSPHGNQALTNLTADINLFVLPAVEVVTPFEILGANYGTAYTEWGSNGVVNVAAVNFRRSTNYGFGDLYVQPVIRAGITPFPMRPPVTRFLPLAASRSHT